MRRPFAIWNGTQMSNYKHIDAPPYGRNSLASSASIGVDPPSGICSPPAQAVAQAEVLIASSLHESGQTGLQTHCRAYRAQMCAERMPCVLVTPYYAAGLDVYAMFGLRRLIEPFSKPAGVWWHRRWHAYFLKRSLRQYLANDQNCVIYAQCPPSASAALAARRSAKQRVVMAVHFNISQADEWAEKGMIGLNGSMYSAIKHFESAVLPRLDGLVFVSEFMRRELLARIPAIAPVPYAVISNFVADTGGQKTGEATRDLITIGSLEHRKNQVYALEIIAAAKRLERPLTLTIVGDGPDRTMLQNRTRDLGLSSLVRFTGYVPNAAQLMHEHRAYLHTATLENMPLTLIEALSRALPVFAPAVGGIPEIFEDGIEGRMFVLEDSMAAAHSVLSLLDSPDLLRDASAAARSRYLRQFQSADVAKRLTAFLQSV